MFGISKKPFALSLGVLSLVFCLSSISLAQDGTSPPRHKHRAKGFKRGVCVGQTLAQEGIILPQAQPGQRPARDPATQAAFKAAVQTCRAQLKGGQPKPSGS